MYRVGACIINWNGSDDTIELLQSLEKECNDELRIDVVVVDNASEIEELESLKNFIFGRECSLDTKLLQNSENIGVPGGYNQAIVELGPGFEYYLRLDNDVVMNKGAVLSMCKTLEHQKSEGIHILGGNSKFYFDRSRDNGGAWSFDLLRGKTSVNHPTFDCDCDGVLGCIMMITGDLVRHWYPEVFLDWLFICTDESELSLRAAAIGWRTHYVSKTIGFHKGGKSTRKVPQLTQFYSARNWVFLSIRYVRPRILIALVLVRILVIALSKLVFGKHQYLTAALRGIRASVNKNI